MRTCPECKNRYAKHTCIKALLHGAIFLATCNAILLLVDVKLANTRLIAPCDRAHDVVLNHTFELLN